MSFNIMWKPWLVVFVSLYEFNGFVWFVCFASVCFYDLQGRDGPRTARRSDGTIKDRQLLSYMYCFSKTAITLHHRGRNSIIPSASCSICQGASFTRGPGPLRQRVWWVVLRNACSQNVKTHRRKTFVLYHRLRRVHILLSTRHD